MLEIKKHSKNPSAFDNAPLLLAVLWVITACIRDLAKAQSIEMPGLIHAIYAISGNFLYPAIFFTAGVFCVRYFVVPRRNPMNFAWRWLGYTFIVWVILQNLVEVIFSGYTNSAAVVSDIYYDFVTKPKHHLWLLLALALNLPVLFFIAKFKWVVKILLVILAVHCCLHPDSSTWFYPANLVTNYLYFGLLGILLGEGLSKIEMSGRVSVITVLAFLILSGLWLAFVDSKPYLMNTKNFLFSHLGILCVIACSQLIRFNRLSLNDSLQLALLFFVMHYVGMAGIRTVLLKTFQYTGVYGHLFAGVIMGFAIPLVVYRFRSWRVVRLVLEAPRVFWLQSNANIPKLTVFGRVLAGCVAVFFIAYTALFASSEWIIAQSAAPVATTNSIQKDSVTASDAEIADGKRLAYLYGCAGGCHGGGMAGKVYHRVAFEGVYHAPNLREAVRRYSDSELMQIVRAGSRPDGHPIMLGMPVAGFSVAPQEHLKRVFQYIRSLPYESGSTEAATLGPLTRLELLLGEFKQNTELVAEADRFFKDHSNGAAELGKLWARAACTECHGLNLQGNEELHSPPLLVAKAYNLDQFKTLLREGLPPDGRDLGLMKQVARVRFSHFTDNEIEQLLEFLTAL